jgi:hypothetical protein
LKTFARGSRHPHKEISMKPTAIATVLLTLGLGACAHAPQPYSFTVGQTGNDIDVVVHTLEANGLKPAQVDRQHATVTTLWFDTGYPFREIDDFEHLHYYTDVFLRYHVSLKREGGKDTVVLAADVQRCAPEDSYVTAAGVTGSCQPMTILFPTQQKQMEALGDKLRTALAGSTTVAARL